MYQPIVCDIRGPTNFLVENAVMSTKTVPVIKHSAL